MTSFKDMWHSLFLLILVWIIWTLLLYRKVKKTGKHFMNQENVFFVGYVGFTLGLLIAAIVSTFRL